MDIEKYIKDNKLIVDSFSPTDKEIRMIKDKWSRKCLNSQEGIKEDDKLMCSICIGEYEIDETITLTPGCKHMFHNTCIVAWLDTKMQCPFCKGFIRSNMLRTYLDDDQTIPMKEEEKDLFKTIEKNEQAKNAKIETTEV